jgi:tetratricopeptide (TPR) repeat protein
VDNLDEVLARASSLVAAIEGGGGGPEAPSELERDQPPSAPRNAAEAEALLKDLIARPPVNTEPCWLLCKLNLSLGRWQEAIEVSRASLDPNVRIWLAEDLIRADRFEEALEVIDDARALTPDDSVLFHVEVIAATALDALAREEDAIAHYNRAALLKPDEWVLQRLTIYDREQGLWPQCRPRLLELQKICTRRLPATLKEGLRAIWQQVGKSQSPESAVDWAWEHADREKWDHGEWLAAVEWGRWAHPLLVDWWRWAPERADEILALIDPPDLTPIREAIAQGRGCVLACAHVGAVSVGVEFLQRSGLPFTSVGFAGTERVVEHRRERRITITANRVATARAVRNALIAGDVIAWTMDSPVGETVTFELLGRPMRFVAAPPKFIARYASASFWCQTLWRGDRIVIEIERLPDYVAGESDEDWTRRWYGAYLNRLERVVRGDPRNLLCLAGMWLSFSPARRFGAAQALERRAHAKAERRDPVASIDVRAETIEHR